MKPEIRIVSITCLAFILFNLGSLLLDRDLLSEFKELDGLKFKQVSEITVEDVFSNSFFFISKKDLNLKKESYYVIKHLEEEDIIYFKVNTIKFNDTLYFFQHINWLTKKPKKIKKGKYELSVSN